MPVHQGADPRGDHRHPRLSAVAPAQQRDGDRSSRVAATWDVVVVGGGPAGASAALGALAERPGARVLVLDRDDFPRDKVCGDGVAPHVLDVLAGVGAGEILADWEATPTLRLSLEPRGRQPVSAEKRLDRPGYVVPRSVLDARIVAAAVRRGAVLRRARVRSVVEHEGAVRLTTSDGDVLSAGVVIGADGAGSRVRASMAPAVAPQRPGTTALALRGYAPVRDGLHGAQVIAFDPDGPRPAYAWSFDTGRGVANVGYGRLLPRATPGPSSSRPSRRELLAGLDHLLPGAATGATDLAGHLLPLSSGAPRCVAAGRVLLAGDAASLINPITGEGIYYAAVSGVLAGRAAAAATGPGGDPAQAAPRYRRSLRAHLSLHLLHTRAAAAVVRHDVLLLAALRASAGSPRVFEDLAELGLARGRLTPRVVSGIAGALARRGTGRAGVAVGSGA